MTEYPFHEMLTNEEKTYEELIQILTIKSTLITPKFGLSILSILADGFHVVEKFDLLVNEVIMNAGTYNDIRKIGKDCIDFEFSAEKLKKGIIAHIWGATILVTKSLPDKTILILPESSPETKTFAAILRAEKTDSFVDNRDIMKLNSELRETLIKALNKQESLEKVIYQLTLKEEKTDE
jgi:hypothetical protein